MMNPARLLETATGEPFDPKYYVAYLTRKMEDVYGLKNSVNMRRVGFYFAAFGHATIGDEASHGKEQP